MTRSITVTFLSLLLLSTLASCTSTTGPTPASRAIELYNGKDLTGWGYKTGETFDGKTESNDKRYSVREGEIVVNAATPANKGIKQLWTTRQFPKDFELRLEFAPRSTPTAACLCAARNCRFGIIW